MKFCINCKHHKEIDTANAFSFPNYKDVCNVENLHDVVDGKPLYRLCSYQRSNEGKCKLEAVLYEPAV